MVQREHLALHARRDGLAFDLDGFILPDDEVADLEAKGFLLPGGHSVFDYLRWLFEFLPECCPSYKASCEEGEGGGFFTSKCQVLWAVFVFPEGKITLLRHFGSMHCAENRLFEESTQLARTPITIII